MKIQEVWFLKGLPASGKSSFAKQKIEEDRKKGIINKRINKDDLRAMLDNSIYSKEREAFVLATRDMIIEGALEMGYDVIIDDTNFEPKHLERVKKIVENYKKNNKEVRVLLEEKFFDTPLETCIERDSLRENPVGEKVIRTMYNKYLKKENENIIKYNPELPDCIVVDVDGTLAIRGNRSPFDYWKAGEDKLNEPISKLVNMLQNTSDHLITIVMTGRENQCDENGRTVLDITQKWLNSNDIHYDDIFIRENGDHRPDFEVKKELYEEYVKDQYNVLYWIDDRKQVLDKIRELGITVLDVAGHNF